MRAWAKKFYKSKAWLKVRDAYYRSKFGLCEICGQPGSIVHHRVPLTPANINNPDVTLNWDNLQLLCIECHNKRHYLRNVADGLAFDEEGNVVEIETTQ